MAGFLQGLSEGLQGFTQGTAHGMDLYSEMSQRADEAQLRGRRKQAEAEVQDLINQGGAKEDPADFSDKLSQIYLKHGDMDLYDKFQSKAMQFKSVKADNLSHQAFMAAGTNPIAAIPLMNQWSEVSGNGMKWSAQALPGGGYRIGTTAGGQSTSTDYATKEQAHMAMADVMERFALKPEDYAKGAVEKARASETERHNLVEEDVAGRKATADIEASGAASTASRAAAGLSGAKAETERQGRGAKIGADEALAAQREQDTIVNTIDKLTPDPTEVGTYEPGADKGLQSSMTTALQSSGMPLGKAFSTSQALSRLPPEQLGALSVENGVWHLPNGMQVPDSDEFSNALTTLIQAAGAGEEE